MGVGGQEFGSFCNVFLAEVKLGAVAIKIDFTYYVNISFRGCPPRNAVMDVGGLCVV